MSFDLCRLAWLAEDSGTLKLVMLLLVEIILHLKESLLLSRRMRYLNKLKGNNIFEVYLEILDRLVAVEAGIRVPISGIR